MRNIRKRVLGGLTAVVLGVGAFAGCAAATASEGGTTTTTTTVVSSGQTAAEVLAANTAVHEITSSNAETIAISLTGSSATTGSDAVTVDAGTITITEPGSYRLTGTLSDGQLVVDTATEGTVTLILDGVTISSSTTAAIAVSSAEAVEVALADGSENTLSDASAYADDAEANAALYSSADLTITGSGALTVHGNGNDGIASQDGLVIGSGTIRHRPRPRRLKADNPTS